MDLLNQLNLVRDNIVVVEPEEEDYNIVKNCRRSADKRKMDRSSRPTVFPASSASDFSLSNLR